MVTSKCFPTAISLCGNSNLEIDGLHHLYLNNFGRHQWKEDHIFSMCTPVWCSLFCNCKWSHPVVLVVLRADQYWYAPSVHNVPFPIFCFHVESCFIPLHYLIVQTKAMVPCSCWCRWFHRWSALRNFACILEHLVLPFDTTIKWHSLFLFLQWCPPCHLMCLVEHLIMLLAHRTGHHSSSSLPPTPFPTQTSCVAFEMSLS